MTWTDQTFDALTQMLGLRTGLAFSPDRRPAVEFGIRRAMERAGVSDPDRYRRRVERERALFDDLVDELTIGETYFYREPGQFQLIRGTILPELRRRLGDQHILKVWSAGCASGEEAFSLAMVFEEERLADRTHLVATDVSPAALAKARHASYTSWSLRGEGAGLALPHLERQGVRYVVKESIRHRVAFEQLNLALDVYPSLATGTWNLDLILCRNVLIYFDRETVRSVAGRLFAALGEGGWLITASSDPPLADDAPFETVLTAQGILYRKPVAKPANDRTVTSLPGVEAGFGPIPGRERVAPLPSMSTSTRNGRAGETTRDTPDGPRAPAIRPTVAEIMAAARDDLAAGRYALAAERTRTLGDVAEASALRVRAMANLEPSEAEGACAEAIDRHPLSCELHYLRAILLHGLGRDDEAARAARRVLFLDRSLAIVHFLLGTILRRRGDRPGAWRSFRNARDLCAARPEAEVVALSDGEPAGRLAEAAAFQMTRLEPSEYRP